MRNGWKLATLILAPLVAGQCVTSALLWHHLHGRASNESGPLAHVANQFEFLVHAPMARVAPLFGAEREKAWAGDEWKPEFLYPSAESNTGSKDVEGAVFLVRHGQRKVPWVNTAYDLVSGHVAYAYFVNAHLVTRIDIHLAARDADTTSVKVLYERTSLSAAANDHVMELGRSDAGSGPEWQAQLDRYLKQNP